MTYVYISRKDGEWARYDFGDISKVDDFWFMIDQRSPELWNVLPSEACFEVENPPREYETFLHMDELIEWVEAANVEAFLVAYTIDGYDDEESYKSEKDARERAEDLWCGLTDAEKESSVVAVLKIPQHNVGYVETLWSRGM